MRKPVTLMAGKFGSRHFGTKPYLAGALELTGKDKPVALYVGAANDDDEAFGMALVAQLEAAGAHKVVWPKVTKRKQARVAARKALDDVDLVFVGGGDVEDGMRALREADLVDAFRTAADRGVVFAGMSAGAVMLGERWIRWPDETAGDEYAETYECMSVAPCSLDVHGEGDNWQETRSFAAVRARELGKKARAYAIPSGGALVVNGRGNMEANGAAVAVFAALPRRPARIERMLEAAR